MLRVDDQRQEAGIAAVLAVLLGGMQALGNAGNLSRPCRRARQPAARGRQHRSQGRSPLAGIDEVEPLHRRQRLSRARCSSTFRRNLRLAALHQAHDFRVELGGARPVVFGSLHRAPLLVWQQRHQAVEDERHPRRRIGDPIGRTNLLEPFPQRIRFTGVVQDRFDDPLVTIHRVLIDEVDAPLPSDRRQRQLQAVLEAEHIIDALQCNRPHRIAAASQRFDQRRMGIGVSTERHMEEDAVSAQMRQIVQRQAFIRKHHHALAGLARAFLKELLAPRAHRLQRRGQQTGHFISAAGRMLLQELAQREIAVGVLDIIHQCALRPLKPLRKPSRAQQRQRKQQYSCARRGEAAADIGLAVELNRQRFSPCEW